MRILVTGGAGFIGSAFTRNVLADAYPGLEGAEVTVLDKLTYAGNLANLESVADSDRYTFELGDICDPELTGKLVGQADAVVHFAAESHVDRSIMGGADFVLTNVLGTQTLLQAALNTKLTKFVHVSTDEVYGSIDSGSWDENWPLEPNSPYSASKASSDLIARAYAKTHGLPVASSFRRATLGVAVIVASTGTPDRMCRSRLTSWGAGSQSTATSACRLPVLGTTMR